MHKNQHLTGGGIVFSATYDDPVPPNIGQNHCHDAYEILYVAEGKGRYIVEGSEYTMRPGTLMVIRPTVYHFVDVARDGAYERYVVNFSPAALADAARPLLDGLCTAEGCGFYSAVSLRPSLLAAFERFSLAATLSEEKRTAYMQMLLSEIVVLLSSVDPDEAADNTELGARVIRYLNEHIEGGMSLDRIVRHFFVSKYYLCRAFKKHNGISIHGYLTQKRVLLAKQLIEGGETAAGAAYRVGFGDYSAFYRAYVKLTGESPAAGRRGGVGVEKENGKEPASQKDRA